MNKMVGVLILLGVLAGCAGKAQDDVSRCDELNARGAPAMELAQQGCCSHHSGVCGCSFGTVQCCDGSSSPSCSCNQNDPSETAPKL